MACDGWLTILQQNPPPCWSGDSVGEGPAVGLCVWETYPSTLQGMWLGPWGAQGTLGWLFIWCESLRAPTILDHKSTGKREQRGEF